MRRRKSEIVSIGMVCLFVDGLILISYAIAVPFFVRGVHWLVTVAVLLFMTALPAIHHTLAKNRKRSKQSRSLKFVAALYGVGMVAIIASDLLYALSLLGRLPHDVIYAIGNFLFILSLFGVGELGMKGSLPKWISVLSIVTGAVGLLTYAPGAFLLQLPSLLLVGLWSLALSLNLR